MVLHFRTQKIGVECGDTEALLTGETDAGEVISSAVAIVKTVGCKRK